VTLTNVWTDSYITNGATKTQKLQRTLASPDIIFTAADLGVDAVGDPILMARSVPAFVNSSALNSVAGGGTLNGPGTIDPGAAVIVFSKMGPWWYQTTGGESSPRFQGPLWGSFDGTTNAPIVYPSGLSIQALEESVLTGSGSGRNPYLSP
jgi:hypothetical protein